MLSGLNMFRSRAGQTPLDFLATITQFLSQFRGQHSEDLGEGEVCVSLSLSSSSQAEFIDRHMCFCKTFQKCEGLN